METATILQSETVPSSEEVVEVSASIYTHKRIEFHLARRIYDTSTANNGFHLETLNPDSWRKRPAAEAGMESRSVGKRVSDGPGFGGITTDSELSFASRICKIGAGLENLGNTCYLNSVLQCLTYTEPLAAYLQSGKHQTSCNITGFCALCAIQKHVIRALESSGRSLVPKDLVSNLRSVSRNFRKARQEDAHEYMINLLESMHKCCLPSGISCESPAAYEKSLVHKIFGGRLRSQVECQQCFYRSDKFDPFLDISLEIAKAESLPTALRNFTASEILDGGEKHYQCLRCKDKVKAKKRLTIHNPPHVLTIHLKRFHAYDPGRKVDKRVYFGPSLDLKPFSSFSHEGDAKYVLYGVLVHFGHNTHSGHYVCFVRTSSGIWYLLNDNEVRAVGEKTVLEQKAYMLFYVRDRRNVSLPKPADFLKTNAIKNVLDEMKAKDFFRFESSNPSKVTASTWAIRNASLPLSSVTRNLPSNPTTSNAAIFLPSVTTENMSVSKDVDENPPHSRSEKPKDQESKNMSLSKDVDENPLHQRLEKPKDQENVMQFLQGIAATKSALPIKERAQSLPSESANNRIPSGESTTASVSGDVASVSTRLRHRKTYNPAPGRLRSFFMLMGIRNKKKFKKLKSKTLRKNIGAMPLSKSSTSDSKPVMRLKKAMILDAFEVKNSEHSTNEVADSDQKDNETSICDATPISIESRIISRTLTTTKVERWDDSGVSTLFPTNGFDSRKKSIGYVPDQWDEEYDRGKRKKIRQRIARINGFNPFQVMATHKYKDPKFSQFGAKK